MVSQRAVVEFRKLSDGALNAGSDSHGPKNAVRTELQVAIASLFEKLLDFFIGGAGKEKNVVEIALPGKFGLSQGKPVFWTSSRGESERKVTTGTPVSRESVCKASAAAGRTSATGMHVNRPRRNVAALLVREAPDAGRRWK